MREQRVKVLNYDLEKTVTCGQFFRYHPGDSGRPGDYVIYAGSDICRVIQTSPDTLVFRLPDDGSLSKWEVCLGLGADYSGIKKFYGEYPWLEEICEIGKGIHIMHIPPWEGLISFIISQRNSVARIRDIVQEMCEVLGEQRIINEPDITGNQTYYCFPTPEMLASYSLDQFKLGYRKQYIVNAARAALSGELDLNGLAENWIDSQIAMQELCRLPGVGIKVASCVCLFSLYKDDVFPIDVWVERSMKKFGITLEDIQRFGKYAGIIQQYLFYYMRLQG